MGRDLGLAVSLALVVLEEFLVVFGGVVGGYVGGDEQELHEPGQLAASLVCMDQRWLIM